MYKIVLSLIKQKILKCRKIAYVLFFASRLKVNIIFACTRSYNWAAKFCYVVYTLQLSATSVTWQVKVHISSPPLWLVLSEFDEQVGSVGTSAFWTVIGGIEM